MITRRVLGVVLLTVINAMLAATCAVRGHDWRPMQTPDGEGRYCNRCDKSELTNTRGNNANIT